MRYAVAFILALLVFGISSAQEIGTSQENACNEGGLFFRDGVSLCETEWHWECGWYIANWQNTGEPIPEWCGTGHKGHLGPAPFPGCVQRSTYYVKFDNQRALPAGAITYSQPDCTSPIGTTAYNFVYARTIAVAVSLCQSVFNAFNTVGAYNLYIYECR